MSDKNQDRLIRFPETMRLTSLSRSVIYEKTKSGEFPKIIKLSERTSVFSYNAVLAWIEEQKKRAGVA